LVKSLADGLRALDPATLANLPATFAEVQPLLAAKGVALAPDTQDYMIALAKDANHVRDRLGAIGTSLVLLLSIVGGIVGVRQVEPRGRARNRVEKLMLYALLGASMIAILTTIGIVLSMLF